MCGLGVVFGDKVFGNPGWSQTHDLEHLILVLHLPSAGIATVRRTASTAVARGEGSVDVNVTVSTNRKWRQDMHPGDRAAPRKDPALADSWPCADPDLTTSLAVISYKLTFSHFLKIFLLN